MDKDPVCELWQSDSQEVPRAMRRAGHPWNGSHGGSGCGWRNTTDRRTGIHFHGRFLKKIAP